MSMDTKLVDFIESTTDEEWMLIKKIVLDAACSNHKLKRVAEDAFRAGWYSANSDKQFDGLGLNAHLDQYLQIKRG